MPDLATFGRAHRRLTPHIYTEQELAELLELAGRLQPNGGLRPATYQALFGVIAATGLRLSEALQLRDADVDLHGGSLTVRETKCKKSRLLPLHPNTVDALGRYQRRRDHTVPRTESMPFFVGRTGHALPKPTVHGIFVALRTRLGWVARGGHSHPRIHDLRHTFAVRRVQQWQQSGVTMDHGMFLLCTYLGHATIAATYWYLTGTPELLATIGTRFERFACPAGEVAHAYRDAFTLLLAFAKERLGKAPTALTLAEIDREFLAAFLDHLEHARHNVVRTRNARLAAVRSFLTFVAAAMSRACTSSSKRWQCR